MFIISILDCISHHRLFNLSAKHSSGNHYVTYTTCHIYSPCKKSLGGPFSFCFCFMLF